MSAYDTLDMPSRVWLRVQDFLSLQDSGAFSERGKTELIEGEILTMNAQFVRHAYAKSLLHLAIDRGLRATGSPLAAIVEGSVAMPPFDLPEPDIVITAKPRRGGPIPVTEVALLVEVSDTTQRFDLGRKAFVYARNRVPEYWVVDLTGQRVVRHWQPGTEGYACSDESSLGGPIASATVSGLIVATDELLGLPDQD